MSIRIFYNNILVRTVPSPPFYKFFIWDQMPRQKKYDNAETHTFSLERDVFLNARRIVAFKYGKSLNEFINDTLKQVVAEFESSSSEVQKQANYENLKRAYSRAVSEVKQLTKSLKKEGVYEDMKVLAYDFGLDFTALSNMAEVAAKLMTTWEGAPEHLHLFINLMEAAQRKKQLERELTNIRRQLYFSSEGGSHGEAISTTDSLQRVEGLSQVRANGASENP